MNIYINSIQFSNFPVPYVWVFVIATLVFWGIACGMWILRDNYTKISMIICIVSLLLAFICVVTAIALPHDIYAEYGETRVKITNEERELIENFQEHYKKENFLNASELQYLINQLKDIQKEEIDYSKFKEH